MNKSKFTMKEIEEILEESSAIEVDYNEALTFTNGIAIYESDAIKDTSVCFVQRRAHLADTGFAFSTHSEAGKLTICGPSTLNTTINVNILIFSV